MGKFYITTTLPYVNSAPHLGHALEFAEADIVARFRKRFFGDDVFFNTGTDEHGQKVYEKALEENSDPQKYADLCAEKYKVLCAKLNIGYTNFIRTTDPFHKSAAQEFWRICDRNGDIYKKLYKTKYCVGCELEKTDSELVNNKCPIHPNLELQIMEEENYFFRFGKYQNKLLELYEETPDFVVPQVRFNEIKKFVESGLEDFSISRLKTKMPWGVPVPGDPEQVMYVWFDALIDYISTLEWPKNLKKFEEFWPGIQFAGKDNLRQQSAMWQAMLMSAGLPNSKQIIIHGFLTSGGEKMSKSLGNVIDPLELIEEYGADALRYYLAREANTFEDSDITREKFKEAYNANLASGLGNLASRVMTMYVNYGSKEWMRHDKSSFESARKEYIDILGGYEIKKAADFIWKLVKNLDSKIQKDAPFKLAKDDRGKAAQIVAGLALELEFASELLFPFLPDTSEKIRSSIAENKIPPALFARR